MESIFKKEGYIRFAKRANGDTKCYLFPLLPKQDHSSNQFHVFKAQTPTHPRSCKSSPTIGGITARSKKGRRTEAGCHNNAQWTR